MEPRNVRTTLSLVRGAVMAALLAFVSKPLGMYWNFAGCSSGYRAIISRRAASVTATTLVAARTVSASADFAMERARSLLLKLTRLMVVVNHSSRKSTTIGKAGNSFRNLPTR